MEPHEPFIHVPFPQTIFEVDFWTFLLGGDQQINTYLMLLVIPRSPS